MTGWDRQSVAWVSISSRCDHHRPNGVGPQTGAPQGNFNGKGYYLAALAQAYSASAFFIFFMAATSIWRMRSALTP